MRPLQRSSISPDQCGARPCIQRMRIQIKDVVDLLASGASESEILESYL